MRDDTGGLSVDLTDNKPKPTACGAYGRESGGRGSGPESASIGGSRKAVSWCSDTDMRSARGLEGGDTSGSCAVPLSLLFLLIEEDEEAEEDAGCSVYMKRLGNKSDSKIPM